jgi:hypothetical protein
MKRTALAFMLALVLLFLATTGAMVVNLAAANPFSVPLQGIVIKSDGTVTPETEFIKQTGSVYTLTADLSPNYTVAIQCSNIVFDGAGHAIIGGFYYFEYYGGLSLHNVTNVTVKDLEVTGNINLQDCSKCVILRVKANNFGVDNRDLVNAGIPGLGQSGSNTIAESSIGILSISYSDNNLITKNNLTGGLGISFSNKNSVTENNITSITVIIGNFNKFFENNFSCENNYFENWGRANSWDNGSIGNYWSDYLTKYPNANEIGNTGIGNTPYVIDTNNVDNYPLMAPFEVQPSPLPEPQPEPEPEQEPFPTGWIVGAAAVIATGGVAITFGIVAYRRKRSSPSKPS